MYRAVLIYPSGISRTLTAAARGDKRDTAIAAIGSLFHVTASALEKYQGNVLKDLASPVESAGGVVDESLIRQNKNKSWSIF